MKKTIFFVTFLILVNTEKGMANQKKDRISEVHSLIFQEALREGHNPSFAIQAFDIILDLFKVRAIYFDSTKTGMNHYSVLNRSITINIRYGKDSVLQKIFAEVTHAVQFTWRPLRYTIKALTLFEKTFFKAVFCKNSERYRQKIDSIKKCSLYPSSRLRTRFIAIYLKDAYCVANDFTHKDCDVKSFEHEHSKIEEELWRLYKDTIFLLPHLTQHEVKSWLKMRKRVFYKDLRHWQGSFLMWCKIKRMNPVRSSHVMKKHTFADQVRAVVRAIPKGETMSYGAVAKKAGYPGAARAVGTVMKNNFDPTVPCHRVICADGTVGAYNRGGPSKKRALLEKEGVIL